MPTQDFKPGGAGGSEQNADLAGAVVYVVQNAGVLATIGRFFAGLIAALKAPKGVRFGLMTKPECPFCHR